MFLAVTSVSVSSGKAITHAQTNEVLPFVQSETAFVLLANRIECAAHFTVFLVPTKIFSLCTAILRDSMGSWDGPTHLFFETPHVHINDFNTRHNSEGV